ncbi:MAG: 50S ribosomal protein L3 [Candidatus Aadella gelida]|nr:50S ribosomal protein L3 [Candidatus Aadella gelida]
MNEVLDMVPGILGKKIGMTQIYKEDRECVPVTVLEVGPCVVQAIKSSKKDGYDALQMGYEDTKEQKLKKPQREQLKANKLKAKRFVREIRCEEALDVKVGEEVTVAMFQEGDFIDITSKSKGKGFQGGMKRHGWSGGPATHGSKTHRAPGSIGASSYPSRVFKGQSMPGQMGNANTTLQNVKVVCVNTENNTLTVKGAVPGANGAYVVLRYALKKALAPRVQKEEEVAEKEENNEETKDKG